MTSWTSNSTSRQKQAFKNIIKKKTETVMLHISSACIAYQPVKLTLKLRQLFILFEALKLGHTDFYAERLQGL